MLMCASVGRLRWTNDLFVKLVLHPNGYHIVWHGVSPHAGGDGGDRGDSARVEMRFAQVL